MQPYLFPYIGYFQLINAVDLFILYDDVNFRKRSWINRNKILLNGHEHMYTFPCKGISQNKLINEIQVDTTTKFIEKFFKIIQYAYEKKAPFYNETLMLLNKIFQSSEKQSIAKFNHISIVEICKYLNIKTEIKIASEASPQTNELRRENRIYSICKQYNGSTYINAMGGKDLYNKEDFSKKGLTLQFISPITTELNYTQLNTLEFVPWLSIIDVLMNNSKQNCQTMLNAYTVK